VALQGPPDWAERPTRLTGGAQPVRSSSSTQATLAIDQCARQLVPRDAGLRTNPLPTPHGDRSGAPQGPEIENLPAESR